MQKSQTIAPSLLMILTFFIFSCTDSKEHVTARDVEIDTLKILDEAEGYIDAEVITVTDSLCPRSAGGRHDFYSEGDYWWPDPEDPDGPYMRRDGVTNPDNFTLHREWMVRLSRIAGALSSAYIITGDSKYLKALIPHIRGWFIDDETKMNPSLMYGQAIKGRVTGRGIGIIDTIHLLEVAKAIQILRQSGVWAQSDLEESVVWFADYLQWMTTHPYGIAERDNGNNHSTCWAMQAAGFADLTGDEVIKDYCRTFYKEVLLPDQMDTLGRFPKEINRTKPYNYSLFNLDAMATVCHILSTPEENLFEYETPDGRGMQLGLEFMYPYIKEKPAWPYEQDVLYWDEWPVKHPCLLFSGLALDKEKYIGLFNALDFDTETFEVLRNMPIRYPVIWIDWSK